MIKILLLAVVPFMTQHRNVVPKTEVSTNFYGSVTGIVDKAYIEARVGVGGGGGCDTNAVDILANSAVVTNALTVATTNRVASLETATNNLSSSVSSLQSSLADKANSADIPAMVKETMSADGISSMYINIGGSIIGQTIGDQYGDLRQAINGKADKATPYTAGNLAALTADGNLSDSGKKASDFAPAVEGGYLPLNDGGHVIGDTTFLGNFYAGPYGDTLGVTHDAGYLYKHDSVKWYYGSYDKEDASEIAVKGDISAAISATNPTFSNAVLAVGLNIDTNSVAVLNEIASTFGGFPLGAGETATTVGGLLAALAAAIAWLKKNKVGSFASVGGATATVENGVAKLSDFFTESNSLLTSRVNTLIDAKVGNVNAVLAAALDGTEVA